MVVVFDTIYDDARTRVCDRATALTPEQLDTTVSATPEWTARQLVAHLAGVAAGAVHGRTKGMRRHTLWMIDVREPGTAVFAAPASRTVITAEPPPPVGVGVPRHPAFPRSLGLSSFPNAASTSALRVSAVSTAPRNAK